MTNDVKNEKKSLLDNVYLAPVVEMVRTAAKGFLAPYKTIGRAAKAILLQRRLSLEEEIGTTGIAIAGVVAGVPFPVGATLAATGSFLAAAGVGLAGAFVGPVAVLAATSVVTGVLGGVWGAGQGVLKLARHLFVPKLLASEQRKEQELKAQQELLSAPANAQAFKLKAGADFQTASSIKDIALQLAREALQPATAPKPKQF